MKLKDLAAKMAELKRSRAKVQDLTLEVEELEKRKDKREGHRQKQEAKKAMLTEAIAKAKALEEEDISNL